MISHALDSSNDLLLVNGRIATTSNGAQVAQQVRCRLRFFLGEWFLDTSAGMPWFQRILTRPADRAYAEGRIKEEILSTTGVDSLLSFSSTYDKTTRRFSVSFSASTTYGEIISDDVYLNI